MLDAGRAILIAGVQLLTELQATQNTSLQPTIESQTTNTASIIQPSDKSSPRSNASLAGKEKNEENEWFMRYFASSVLASLIIGGLSHWLVSAGGMNIELSTVWIASTLIGLVAGFLLRVSARCSKCGAEWSVEQTHEDLIGIRESVRYQGSDKRRVAYEVKDYWQNYKCKKCGNKTKKRKQKKKEIY